jgi:hypothetical protein
MTSAHILTGVGHGTPKRHRQKALLFRYLSVHIDIVEESADAVVRKHLPIEDVNRSVHSRFAADLFVERLSVIHKDAFIMHVFSAACQVRR